MSVGENVAERREVLWCEAFDTLDDVIEAIEREQKRLSAAALGVCEECESGWIDQGGEGPDDGVAPCPYCQPEKYRKTPWSSLVPKMMQVADQ